MCTYYSFFHPVYYSHLTLLYYIMYCVVALTIGATLPREIKVLFVPCLYDIFLLFVASLATYANNRIVKLISFGTRDSLVNLFENFMPVRTMICFSIAVLASFHNSAPITRIPT